jgi:toxin FitB
MIVLDTNVISELRKKPHNQAPKVCAWAQTHPASAFYLTTLTIMEIERGTLLEEARNSPQGPPFGQHNSQAAIVLRWTS